MGEGERDTLLGGGVTDSGWLLREEESHFFGNMTANRLPKPQWAIPHPCTHRQH